MKTKIYLFVLIILSSTIIFSCDGESEKNYPPQIILTLASPDILPISGSVTFTASVTDKNGLSNLKSVTINLFAIGGASDQKMFDDGTNGDVNPGNGDFTFAFNVPLTVSYNIYNLTITATDKKNATSTAKVQVIIYTGTQIHVAPTGYPLTNIQDGIDAAGTGDLVIVHNGVYTGNKNRNLDFKGKEIFVRSENGAGMTIIDCQGSSGNDNRRGFKFSNGEGAKSILEGFTIKNGWEKEGGGMKFENHSSPTIKNCIIKDCIASDNKDGGGGIYLENNCYPLFLYCTFKDNVSYFNGGAAHCENNAVPIFQSCVFDSNTAFNDGGAFMCENNAGVTIKNCLIINNLARENGGAFYSKHGFLTVESSTITDNKARKNGGAFATETSSETTVLNSIIWANVADSDVDTVGEGNEFNIENSSAFLRLNNCIFADSTGDVVDTGSKIAATDCINADPKFVDAGTGDYHLEQKNSGQINNSPGLNAGSADVTTFEYLAGGSTTRTDDVRDVKTVDIGYHYFP